MQNSTVYTPLSAKYKQINIVFRPFFAKGLSTLILAFGYRFFGADDIGKQ